MRIARRQAARLDAATIPQFVTPLWIPPAMPVAGLAPLSYSVAARPIAQQVLPPSLPATPVFAYGSTTDPATFHAPSYTIEAVAGRPAEVTWANQLVDPAGSYVPPLLPVDPARPWANPPGGPDGRDRAPSAAAVPGPYTGPVPMVVRLHGARAEQESDGCPQAWYLPAATDIPDGYATAGSSYERFRQRYAEAHGHRWALGTARFHYDNDQRATQLWFHDHALGMTRLNVRAGLHGMYIIRGGPRDLTHGQLPGPAPQPGDVRGTRYYEVPLILADATFNADGSLHLPGAGGGDGPTGGPWEAALGSAITVNGSTWPYLAVEPRRYRFRVLNAAGRRTFVLKVAASAATGPLAAPARPIWVIGADGGLLPAAVRVDEGGLPVRPAQCYDVIVDFTGLPAGTRLYLVNEGGAAAAGTTGLVLAFDVVPLESADLSIPPGRLTGHLPAPPADG
ncbi:MAG TPA: hypothetical protein VH478_23800 [Trebonia sp.]|nr:hypothetical protein [Trebonia sp.]